VRLRILALSAVLAALSGTACGDTSNTPTRRAELRLMTAGGAARDVR
jgi:hypothetical protein